MRLFIAVLAEKVVARVLLLAGKQNRLGGFVGVKLLGAENLLVKKVNNALFEQGVDDRIGNARIIADLLNRRRARHLEQLGYFALLWAELYRG